MDIRESPAGLTADWRDAENGVESAPRFEDDESAGHAAGVETASKPDDSGRRGLDGVALYKRMARRHPRPSAEEERRRLREMWRAERAMEAADPPPPEAVRAFEHHRERLLLGHLGLVVRVAERYARRYSCFGLPLDDLIQEGNLGLMEALDAFEPGHGARFATYAAGAVRSHICRALSSKARTIKIPLARLALRRLAAGVAAELEQRYRGEACCDGRRHRHVLEDDAALIGIPVELLRAVIRQVPEFESLDEPAAVGAPPRGAFIADERSRSPREAAETKEAVAFLREALPRLPERHRTVLSRRFGLDGEGPTGLAEIGESLGVSPQRVHQLLRRALELLRADPHLR